MSKYVRSVKRNQIIQRWLQGIEDPEYEVFPTKKEGKYIVKLREIPIIKSQEKEPVETQINDSEVTNSEEIPVEKEPKLRQRTVTRSSDSTINLEILEQLRNLGEEICNDRFKKEQKHYIKQIVNKEINKSRAEQGWQGQLIRSKYVPDVFPENESVNTDKPVEAPPKKEESIQEIAYQEPQPEPPIFRSRIRR